MKSNGSHSLLVLAIGVLACGDDPAEPLSSVADISITPPELQIGPGETFQLHGMPVDENGEPVMSVTVRWSSSDSSVVSVDDVGNVEGLKIGEASVMATVGEIAAAAAVRVICDVAIVSDNISIRVGDSQELATNVDCGSDGAIDWSSTNPDVTRVSANGAILGLHPGSSFVIASSRADPVARDSITVSVTERFRVRPDTASVCLNGTVQFYLDNPEPVTWSSSSPSVASVDDSGTTTAHSTGEATITASSQVAPPASATALIRVVCG